MPKANKTAAQMVGEAKERVENLTVEQVAEELETDEALLVDLREGEELGRDGAIPGSVNAPRGMLEFYADPASPYHREEFDPERRTILYCASGGRSASRRRTSSASTSPPSPAPTRPSPPCSRARARPRTSTASNLYGIDLSTGAAADLGQIGEGEVVKDLAIPTAVVDEPLPETGGVSFEAVALTGGALLLSAGLAFGLFVRRRAA